MPSRHLNVNSARTGTLPSVGPSVERTGTAGSVRQASNALERPWPLAIGLLLAALLLLAFWQVVVDGTRRGARLREAFAAPAATCADTVRAGGTSTCASDAAAGQGPDRLADGSGLRTAGLMAVQRSARGDIR